MRKFLGYFFIVSAFFLLTGCWPFKETDPASKNFELQKLDLFDYKNHKSFYHAMATLFPEGTPKSKVDEILKNIVGCTVKEKVQEKSSFYKTSYRLTLNDRIENDRDVLVKYNSADHTVKSLQVNMPSGKMRNWYPGPDNVQLKRIEFNSKEATE